VTALGVERVGASQATAVDVANNSQAHRFGCFMTQAPFRDCGAAPAIEASRRAPFGTICEGTAQLLA
jgi:hypothetical protein